MAPARTGAVIYIDGLPFRRDQEELTESGIGITAWAGGEYQYPLADRYRLRARADVSRREYKGGEFDQMTLAAHLGPRWLVGQYTDASLLTSVRQHWQGSKVDHRDLGLRVEGRHRLGPRATANASVSRRERRYEERTDFDGPVTDASLGVGYVVTPTMRTDAEIGWGKEQTELQRWSHTRRWVRAGVTVALPWGFTVGGSGSLRWTDFQGNWFPFTTDGSPRSDVTRSLRVFAFNRAFTLQGFSPQLSVVQEERTSSAQLYGYERVFGELSFVRLF